jgi:integrase
MPQFWADLAPLEGIAPSALRFTILTACRTSEVLGMQWSEIDGSVWTIPPERMKARREHRVPLSDAALSVIEALPHVGEYVFAGRRYDRPISNMAMLQQLQRMGYGDITVHGFRSTFRDWAEETTGYSSRVCEAALAHVVGDKTVAAYQRGDLFAKRRQLMTAWAAYVGSGSNVVALKA